MGYLANRRLRTNGGHTIGEHVEHLTARVDAITHPIPLLIPIPILEDEDRATEDEIPTGAT
jgi:hypothetical protein